jgi:predicted transcriptional regulator
MIDGRFRFRAFKSAGDLVREGLGPLERRVLEVAWSAGRVTVRDVHTTVDAAAYTTVMTTMDRLFKKGLLARTKEGRAFVYSPVATREEIDRAVAADVIGALLSRDRAPAPVLLSNLVHAVGDQDASLLDELERLVHEKRKQLKGRP